MKFKNYKAAIHNFAHSFQSVDYTKSGKLALNVLIRLNNLDQQPNVVFDFINNCINPSEAISSSSKQLLQDYINWLPTHFINHNCDIQKLEKLQVTITADFEKAFTPHGMKDCKQIRIYTSVVWQADSHVEQTIKISQDELIDNNFLKIGIPEF